MISTKSLILEMERQLAFAKQSGDEQSMREAFAAIRSLCEVALGGPTVKAEPIQPKMLQMDTPQKISSLQATPLKEDDANGNSIFDF